MFVRHADNDVLPGVRTTAAMLEQGKMLISEKCVNLREEMMGYQWDEKKADEVRTFPSRKLTMLATR